MIWIQNEFQEILVKWFYTKFKRNQNKTKTNKKQTNGKSTFVVTTLETYTEV